MFGATDDDDLDFNPAAGSKLASLFNLEKSSEKGNASLTYTPPKQPKQQVHDEGVPSSRRAAQGTSASTSGASKLSLIIVKAVNSFKLEDGAYKPQGKLGLALLGNSVSRLFQLLLYKGKQQQITTVKITPNFQFSVQPNLYASFYDDRAQYWSILFESKDDAMEFTTQVAVARYRSAASNEESVITQELLPGTGESIKERETVLLSLSAQPLDMESVQAVDLRKSILECAIPYHTVEGSGWSAGILGKAPGSVCVILVPLSTQLPWLKSKRNEPLIIEISISKSPQTNHVEKLPTSEEKVLKQNITSGVDSAVDSSAEDSTVLSRSASIKEALSSSPRSNKASIISRMARMGQATLPLKGAITCNPSDSEETEDDSGPASSAKPPLKARPVKLRSALRQQAAPQMVPATGCAAPATMTVVQAPMNWNQHQQNIVQRTGNDGSLVQIVGSEGQIVSLNSPQQLPMVAAGSMLSPPDSSAAHMSMFMSEARIQNTEMRMNLSKFGDKIDHLISKVDNLQMASGSPTSSAAPAIGLEPNALLFSIEKLVKDNQLLNLEVAEKNKRLDEQNERIFSLLNTNSKFLEQSSSLLEQKQLQEQNQKKHEEQIQHQEQQSQLLQQIREEKLCLGNKLASLQNQLASVQELVQALQKSNKDLNQELEVMRGHLQEKENSIRDLEIARRSSGVEDEELTKALQAQKMANTQLQEQITHLTDQARTEQNKFKNLEQEHQAEINELKSQMKKLSESHAIVVSNLETKYYEANKLLQQDKPNKVGDGSAPSLERMITDVKLLMNTLHKGLNQQFAPGQSYDGAQVRSMISNVVKREALQFVGKMEMQSTTNNDLSDIPGSESKLASSSSSSLPASQPVIKREDQNPKEFVVLAAEEKQVEKSAKEVLSNQNESESVSITKAELLNTHTESAESHSDAAKEVDSLETSWRPSPPPPPLFHDEDDSDDWLT